MGFFNKCLEVAETIGAFVVCKAMETNEEIDRRQERYRHYSDEKLIKSISKSTGLDLLACNRELCARGIKVEYTNPKEKQPENSMEKERGGVSCQPKKKL